MPFCSLLASVFSPCRSATPTPATASEETPMTIDYSLAALVTAGLMIYLVYALLTPEKF
jgi:K+-transporting ATPase KdpF subunit